ncbi:MAG: CHAD domain-containing protein, partial [Desulfobacterales bacterium]|nr:CHAD domain-containing protein [Desulfobacterales bacterium]
MNTPPPRFFTLPDRVKLKKLNNRLGSSGLVLAGSELKNVREGVVLDSFEDDLRKENAILIQTGETLTLIPGNADLIRSNCLRGEFRFPDTLAEGPMRTLLENLVPLRAVLPKGEVLVTTDTLRLLDHEDTTCCHVDYVTLKNDNGTWSWLKTRPMKGYEDSYLVLAELLADMAAETSALSDALKLPVSGYVAKPKISLNPDDPAKKSLCTIVSTFIGVARQNEAGIIADHDTEFLHDYRVSLRKVRSVLSLFKGVFDKATHAR